MLFKDEVRKLVAELGLSPVLVWRQPFPGPGLAIRIIGDITDEKLEILQDADFIFRQEIANAGLDRDINQYFAVLTNMRSVGVMGDARTYDYTVALRAVTTSDFMTADFAKIPYEEQAILPINLLPGKYTAKIQFNEDNIYISSVITADITVNKVSTSLTSNNLSFTYGDAADLFIALKDSKGNALKEKILQ